MRTQKKQQQQDTNKAPFFIHFCSVALVFVGLGYNLGYNSMIVNLYARGKINSKKNLPLFYHIDLH